VITEPDIQRTSDNYLWTNCPGINHYTALYMEEELLLNVTWAVGRAL
jgi:hypothetical protein